MESINQRDILMVVHFKRTDGREEKLLALHASVVGQVVDQCQRLMKKLKAKIKKKNILQKQEDFCDFFL